MSGMNLAQVYAANPITSNTNTDLMYFDVGGVDAGMQFQHFVALNATNATKVQTTAVNTNATWFPLFVSSATNGDQSVSLAASGLGFNPSTGLLTATGFSGPLTGNVTGNVSGSSGSCTGNAATASAVALGGITGLGTGVATALAINVGSAGAPVLFNDAGGTPSSMTATNLTGTASSLTAGQASALVGNTPSYLSNSSVGNSVSGSTGNYQSGAAHISLTQGTWRVKMYGVMNFGASTVGCAIGYNSGFFGADGANNSTPPTAIAATVTGQSTYNGLSGGGTYNPMPNQTNTGNFILFPLECYITVASGTQNVYAVLAVFWATSTTLLWGSFIEAFKVSN